MSNGDDKLKKKKDAWASEQELYPELKRFGSDVFDSYGNLSGEARKAYENMSHVSGKAQPPSVPETPQFAPGTFKPDVDWATRGARVAKLAAPGLSPYLLGSDFVSGKVSPALASMPDTGFKGFIKRYGQEMTRPREMPDTEKFLTDPSIGQLSLIHISDPRDS